MMKRLGIGFGSAFLFGGILGFVPGVVKDDMYFGIFMVNPAHNALHILSGSMFLIAAISGDRATRSWFQIFGLFYGVLAALGFLIGDGMILGLISNNRMDAGGHTLLALAMLLIGFAKPKQTPAAPGSGQ